jgi:hypothetical protein
VPPEVSGLLHPVLPLLFGAGIGLGATLIGIRRWFRTQSATPSGDILTLARRLGLRVVAGAVAVTLAGALWLARQLGGGDPWQVAQSALIGVPLGLAAGLHWTLRRGRN